MSTLFPSMSTAEKECRFLAAAANAIAVVRKTQIATASSVILTTKRVLVSDVSTWQKRLDFWTGKCNLEFLYKNSKHATYITKFRLASADITDMKLKDLAERLTGTRLHGDLVTL